MLLPLLFSSVVSFAQVHIAVIDSGVPTNLSHFRICSFEDFTGKGDSDALGHGTNVANLILNELKDIPPEYYCFDFLKVFDVESVDSLAASVAAMKRVLELDVQFVNYSGGGDDISESEKSTLKTLLASRNTKVFVAAGNNGMNLSKKCNYYPACYNLEFYNENLVVVGNGKNNDRHAKTSNYGLNIVNIWEDGNNKCGGGICLSGTSQATAIATGKAAKSFIIRYYSLNIKRAPAK